MIVPVVWLAYSIQTKWELLCHPPKRTTWAPTQIIASPGCNSPLLIFPATYFKVDVVLDVPRSQDIETNPEQSVLYPSTYPISYPMCLSTQFWPLEMMVDLAMQAFGSGMVLGVEPK